MDEEDFRERLVELYNLDFRKFSKIFYDKDCPDLEHIEPYLREKFGRFLENPLGAVLDLDSKDFRRVHEFLLKEGADMGTKRNPVAVRTEPKIIIRIEGGFVLEWETNVDNLEVVFFDTHLFDARAWAEAKDDLCKESYSVLLEYPDGATYYAWVIAPDETTAVDAAKADYQRDHPGEDLPDFEVLLVIKGHIDADLRKEDF